MPAITPSDLVAAVLNAIEESGYSGLLISSARSQPRKFSVVAPDGRGSELWVYVWTATPGGRPQLEFEYRIQMTGVQSPLGLNPVGSTILVGYEADLNVFAGFDILRHRIFTTGSPSVQ